MFTSLSPRGRRGTFCALVTTIALAAAIAPQPGLSKQPAVVVSTNSGLVGGTTSTDGNMLIWRGSLTASENRVPNCHRPWLRGTEPAAMFTGSADKCHSGEASERRGSILRSARLG
jgi:hypothetical protein